MAVLKVGDVGKIIRLDANGFDLSGNTDLRLVFTRPGGTLITKTSSDGITAPAVTASGFAANEYWEYPTEAGLLDIKGEWKIHGEYVDATPKDFCGDTVLFDVDPCDVL